MNNFFIHKDKILLAVSLFIIYLISPLIGFRYEVGVSFIFGILVVLASSPVWNIRYILKYIFFLVMIVLTRHSLCCWQPWNFLFDHGLYEPSAWPFVVISAVSSLMGWFLLDRWKHRMLYFFITMGIQMVLFLLLMNDLIDPVLVKFPHVILSKGEYPSIWEAWQFEWMLVYYLPIYFLSRKDKSHE